MDKFKAALQNEQTQRAILQVGGMVVTLIATSAFSSLMSSGINLGIDKLMEKMHPIIDQAAG